MTQADDRSFDVSRTSGAGGWSSASGAATYCDLTVKFSTGSSETGKFSTDCSAITWSDRSQWARVESDGCSKVIGPAAMVAKFRESLVLGNGYTCAVVDLAHPRLAVLKGDFAGNGAYGKNAMADAGLTLEREGSDGSIHRSSDAGPATAKVLKQTEDLVEVVISGIHDSARGRAASDTWTLSLAKGARSLQLKLGGTIDNAVNARALRYNFAFTPTSIYALFDRGVVQMLGAKSETSHYASADGIGRLYALGGPGGDLETAGNVSVALRRGVEGGVGVVVRDSRAGGAEGYSGFQDVIAGSLPEVDTWSAGWSNVTAQQLSVGTAWTFSYELGPNKFDFPVQGPFGDLPTSGNIADEQLQAMLTGIYGSPVGQLCTHDNGVVKGERVGQMATTIAKPYYGYRGNYNFFDPDNYLSTAALLFSGDPYLQEQVRFVLEHNGDFINDKGQLPHHFKGVTPTYTALSGITQTGPNVFWILSCFNYAKSTGNLGWLRGYMPKLRHASAFLFDMIKPGFNLLSSPGSLMIDVFIRSNFTTDTNAMVVGFLREFADAEQATGNATGAADLRSIAVGTAEAAEALLFSNTTGDHYVTQLNPDGTTRDFVDYDANFIALAHGLADADRAAKIFARVDAGRCVHGRASFVAEKYYAKRDTVDGNRGDSWCAMGRIGWFDALARKRYGDQKTFDNLLLNPLIGDVNRWTWLYERYDCDGAPQLNRTSHYFEYPSVTAMMVHYIRYGVQLGFNSVTVTPFGPSKFKYHVGNVHLEYDSKAGAVALSVPGQGSRVVSIEGLAAGQAFEYQWGPGTASGPWPAQACTAATSSVATTTAAGVLTFDAVVGDQAGPCVITVKVQTSEAVIVV